MAKILVVEDSEVTARFLNSLLTEKGFKIKILQTGAGIVDEARKFGPHLILMDILLPDMDGAEAVRMIQSDAQLCDIPVIFLSAIIGQDNKKDNTISINDKIYPALNKSITTNELMNIIKTVLNK